MIGLDVFAKTLKLVVKRVTSCLSKDKAKNKKKNLEKKGQDKCNLLLIKWTFVFFLHTEIVAERKREPSQRNAFFIIPAVFMSFPFRSKNQFLFFFFLILLDYCCCCNCLCLNACLHLVFLLPLLLLILPKKKKTFFFD